MTMPITEPIRIRRVMVRALKSKFLIDGKPAEPGQTTVMDLGDSQHLVRQGYAEVVREESPRALPLESETPRTGRWSATRW